jgi:XisH protein
MSVRDKFHAVVKNALIRDGWQITNDPLFLKVGGVEFYIDLGAEKLLAARYYLAKSFRELLSKNIKLGY